MNKDKIKFEKNKKNVNKNINGWINFKNNLLIQGYNPYYYFCNYEFYFVKNQKVYF